MYLMNGRLVIVGAVLGGFLLTFAEALYHSIYFPRLLREDDYPVLFMMYIGAILGAISGSICELILRRSYANAVKTSINSGIILLAVPVCLSVPFSHSLPNFLEILVSLYFPWIVWAVGLLIFGLLIRLKVQDMKS
jgi:hypothetical protein